MASARATRAPRPAARHRRRRLGQDQHACPPRRASHRQRRRSAPHPADDLLPPRLGGDGAPRRAHHAQRAGRQRARRRMRWPGPAPFTASARGCCATTPSRSASIPSFTIHDREDSADLMNLVRHALGFSKTETGFRPKAPASAIYSRCVNAEMPIDDVLHASFVVRGVGEGIEGAVRRLRRSQAAPERARLRRPAALLGADGRAILPSPRTSAAASITCWSTSTRTPTACRPRSCWALKPDGRGLTVVGDDAQSIYSFRAATVRNILDFPQQFSPPAEVITLDRNYRSTQADPRRRQRRHRPCRRAVHQEPVERPRRCRAPAARRRARRGRPGALHRRARAGEPRGRRAAEAAGGAVPRLAS